MSRNLGAQTPGTLRVCPRLCKDYFTFRRFELSWVRSPGILFVFSFDLVLPLRDIPVLEHTNDTVIEDIVFIVLSGTHFVGSIKK